MRATRIAWLGALAGLLMPGTAAGQTFDLSWHTIDGGGGTSTGGGFTLSGTIGQPDAGVLTGGNFTLSGGFWPGASTSDCPAERGDADCDGLVNFFDIDPFVIALFDPAAYAASYCDAATCTIDINCDGLVNFFDIDPFVACLFSGCPPCP